MFKKEGFTLAEMLMVLALLAILVGMTMSRFSSAVLVGADTEGTINEIVATLRLAKKLAKSEGRDYRVRFSGSSSFTSYAIQEHPSGSQYRDESHTITTGPKGVDCRPAGSGADALQDVVFLSKKGARVLNSSGNDIADSSYHSISCSGGTKSGTITIFEKTGRISSTVSP